MIKIILVLFRNPDPCDLFLPLILLCDCLLLLSYLTHLTSQRSNKTTRLAEIHKVKKFILLFYKCHKNVILVFEASFGGHSPERASTPMKLIWYDNHLYIRLVSSQLWQEHWIKPGRLQGEATWLTEHVAPTRSILRLSSAYKQSCKRLWKTVYSP